MPPVSSRSRHYRPRKYSALIIVFLGILSLVASCSSNGSQSKSMLQQILNRGYVIVGTGTANPPWHFTAADGQREGFDVDMGHMLAEAMFGSADKVKFETESADGRIPALNTGKVDIIFQYMTVTGARATQVAFSAPYFTEGLGLLLPANSQYHNYQDLQDAVQAGKTITIANLQNVDADAAVQELLKGAKTLTVSSNADVYQAIQSGRATAGAIELSSIKYLIRTQPGKWVDSGRQTRQQNYAAAMKLGDPEWVNYVNTVLTDLMSGEEYPEYYASYKKWFGDELPPPSIGRPEMFGGGTTH